MQRLIDRGRAYPAGGDVDFDVRTDPRYGELSGSASTRCARRTTPVTRPAKRDPRDFTLWKGAKPGEPSWDTPWGPAAPAGTWNARPCR